MELTEEQENVVYANCHHARVTATAGSGKTTTMIMRIIYLLHLEGVKASDILVLMFNRDVADDFKSRLQDQCKAFGKSTPDVDTFHGKGYKIYLELAKKRKLIPYYSMNFSGFDWRQSLAKTALQRARALRKDKDKVSNAMAEDFLNFMEIVKSDIIPVREKFEQLKLQNRYDYYIDAFEFFELERMRKKKMHYEDQIREPVMAMLENESIRKTQENKYKYIIVDEYQDINATQQELVKCLAGNKAGVMVVGDADQCIYEWRGARPEFITHTFVEDFEGADTFNLSYTFRNGHAISLAANSCIRNNMERIPQLSYSWGGHKTPYTEIKTHASKPGDSVFSNIVKEWVSRGHKLNQIVFLTRLWAMAADVEVDLLRNRIPYRMGDPTKSIVNNDFTVAMIGFLKLAKGTLGNEDEESFLNYMKCMMSLTSLGMEYEDRTALFKSIWKNPSTAPQKLRDRAKAVKGNYSKLDHRLNVRADLWETLTSQKYKDQSDDKIMLYAYEMLKVQDHYETTSFKEETAENKKRFASRIFEIAKTACEAGSSFIDLYEECIANANTSIEDGDDIIEITTIHRAKGYEWPCVIMPGVQEGTFPYYKGNVPPEDVESERRAFYVGITRAEKELHLIHPYDEAYTKAAEIGSTNTEHVVEGMASRFLYEANIKVAKDIAKAIRDGSRITYSYENGTVAQEYTQDLGFDVKIESKLSKQDKKLYSKPRGLHYEEGETIYVQHLGEGVVKRVEKEGEKMIIHAFIGGNTVPILVGGNLEIRKVMQVA